MMRVFSWFDAEYADFDFVINSCTAEPAFWQIHVNYILAISASLIFYEEPWP